MAMKRENILPSKFIPAFMRNFSTHELFLNLHIIVSKIKNSSVTNFNIETHLALDKSRKIIRIKQDQFIFQLVRKIQNQYSLSSGQDFNQLSIYKITLNQMEKFMQIFMLRQKRFTCFLESIAKLAQFNRQGLQLKTVYLETIQTMKSRINAFGQKLSFLVKKYEQKHLIKFTNKLNQSHFHPINSHDKQNPNKLSNQQCSQMFNTGQKLIQNPQNKKSYNQEEKAVKQKLIHKIGDDASKKRNIQNYQNQIQKLKSKYYRLNCVRDKYFCLEKQEKLKTNQNDNSGLSQKYLFSQETKGKDKQKNYQKIKTSNTGHLTGSSEVKYSIIFTKQKKYQKLKKSFSIFSQSNNNVPFYKNCNIKQGNQESSIGNLTQQVAQENVVAKKRGSVFLRRGSRNQRTSKIDEVIRVEKTHNSVYRQTDFSIQTSKRQLDQSRHSTTKISEISFYQQSSGENNYLNRKSQTQTNIDIGNYQQLQQQFDQESVKIIQKRSASRKKTNFSIVQVQKQNDDDDCQTKQLQDYRIRNKKNRRKGFSKKHIEQIDESYNIIPIKKQIKPSGIQMEGERRQRGFYKTSFFRSSGYMNKKTVQKIGKTKFQNLNRNKSGSQSNDVTFDNNIENNAKNTLKKRFTENLKPSKQNGIKKSLFSVSSKDFAQLSKQISSQSKKDQYAQQQSYIFDLMRSKYDLQFKRTHNEEDFNFHQTKFYRPKLRIMQSQVTYKQKQKLTSAEDTQLFDFSRKFSNGLNQLGQKELSLDKYNYQFPDLHVFV